MQALLTGVLLTALAAGAAAQAEKSMVSFAQLDKDGDGRISVTEATAHRRLSRAFPSVDADRDDYISEREFLTWVDSQSAADGNRTAEPHLLDNPREQASIPAPQPERW